MGVARTVRVRPVWIKWREVDSLLVNCTIPLKSRARVSQACIRSVILYGAATWALARKLMEVLRVSDNRMLRCVARIR